MAREAHDGGRVARGAARDAQRRALESVRHARLEVAGKAFLAVGAPVAQLDRGIAERFAVPRHFVEAPASTVKCVGAVVCGEREVATGQREARAGDAIRVATDDATEARVRAEIVARVVEAERHVGGPAAGVGHAQAHQRRAVAEDRGFEARRAAQREAAERARLGAQRGSVFAATR